MPLFLFSQCAKRRRVLKAIASHLKLCIEREGIMRQMQSWIESTAEQELNKPARIYLFSPDLLLEDLPSGIASEMHGLGKALVRLKVIADSLGIGEGNLEEDLPDEGTERQQAKPRRPRTKIIYNGKRIISCATISLLYWDYRAFSHTWSASMQIYLNKRKRLHKKRVQLLQDWFGTPT